jgi:hypothetical protein
VFKVITLNLNGIRSAAAKGAFEWLQAERLWRALAFLASGPTGSGLRVRPCRLTPQSSLQLQLILEADLRGAEGLDS